jgi:hypothetical protein
MASNLPLPIIKWQAQIRAKQDKMHKYEQSRIKSTAALVSTTIQLKDENTCA